MVRAKHSTFFNVAEKRGTLYLVIVGIWLLILAGSAPSFWRTFSGLDSVLAKGLFLPFAGCLALFWFYGVNNVVLLVFSYLGRPDPGARAQALVKEKPFSPRVAIIYTTYNDFNREAASTCLNQDYPDYHVFIVDVSTNPEMRKQVDAFQEDFASATTLVRLQPRQGFKGRSLNDTLKTVVGDEYEFFAVCDADSYLPSDFLSRTMPYFLLDERIAFVQANHTSRGHNQTKFAKDFEVTVDPWWRLDQLPRARYGFHMCVGHGVVIRREAWEKVGGYPEVVEEDRTFSMRLREHGYYGCFAPEVVCGEEFPQDFGSWRRREFRLVQAKIEILSTEMPRFLRNKGVSFTEKLDLLVRMIGNPSQALALPFLLLAFPLIPLANEGTLSVTSIDRAFDFILSPGLVAVTLLTAAAPLYPFFVYLRRKPLELVHVLFRIFTLHCSRLTFSIISVAVYILRGRATFLVTGAQDGAAIQSQPTGVFRRFLQRLSPDSPLVTALEIVSGLALAYIGIATASLVFLGFAFVLLLSPMMRRFGWQNKAMSVAVYLPLALVIVGLVLSLSGGIGAQSQYLVLAVLSVLLYY